MLILLCGNNVRACAFYVECNATRDLTMGFFAVHVHIFHMHPHVDLVWK